MAIPEKRSGGSKQQKQHGYVHGFTRAGPDRPTRPARFPPPRLPAPLPFWEAAPPLEGGLGRGETLARALGKSGVSPQLVLEITRTLAPHFDFRSAQPGHRFRIARGPQGELVDFEYLTAPNTGWHMERSGEGYEVTPDAQRVFEFKRLGLRLRPGEAGLVMSKFGWHIMKRVE